MNDGRKYQTRGAVRDVVKILGKVFRAHAKDRGQKPENGRVLRGQSRSYLMVR